MEDKEIVPWNVYSQFDRWFSSRGCYTNFYRARISNQELILLVNINAKAAKTALPTYPGIKAEMMLFQTYHGMRTNVSPTYY